MKSSTKRRLDAVANTLGTDTDDCVGAIFVGALASREELAEDYDERECIGLLSMKSAEQVRIVRKPGESLAEMDARAEKLPKDNPLCVAMWFRVYRGRADDLSEFEAAREIRGTPRVAT